MTGSVPSRVGEGKSPLFQKHMLLQKQRRVCVCVGGGGGGAVLAKFCADSTGIRNSLGCVAATLCGCVNFHGESNLSVAIPNYSRNVCSLSIYLYISIYISIYI